MLMYPRNGQALAPVALSELLGDPMPNWARDHAGSIKELRDLDADAWTHFPHEVCEKLGRRVVSCVQAQMPIPRALSDRILGPAHPGLTLADLHLEPRTHNCLVRAGYANNVEALAGTTIGQLLDIRSFGAKSLVDFLTAYESRQFFDEETRLAVVAIWDRLRHTLGVPEIRADDPRFGVFVRRIEGDAQDLDDAMGAGGLVDNNLASRHVLDALESLEMALSTADTLSLEAELLELATMKGSKRNGAIAARFQGWDGRGGCTLQTVGDEYGLTRERVRQIAKRVTDSLAGVAPYAPALDLALSIVRVAVPEDTEDLAERLKEEGVSERDFNPDGLSEAAMRLGRPFPYMIESIGSHRVVVQAGDAGLVSHIRALVRQIVSRYGVANVPDIAARCAEDQGSEPNEKLVREILEGEPQLEWLDNDEEWFWFHQLSRNTLIRYIRKIASVAPRISVADLRNGIGRHYRMKGFVPPRRVLLRLCSELEGFSTAGTDVIADPPPSRENALGLAENTMVDVLLDNGPVLQIYDFERLCLERGLNRSTFWQYLTYQPEFVRLSPGFYSLRGAVIPRGTLEDLQRRAKKRGRVLTDFGWTTSGEIWLMYRVSQALVSSSVVTIPAAMKPYLSGSYAARAEDGTAMGKVTIGEGAAWGLNTFLRRSGADEGDTLLLVIDPRDHQLTARLGDESLADEGGDAATALGPPGLS